MGKYNNMLVCHGGGPTAVINASLYGVITEGMKTPGIGRIYGVIGGTGGLVTDPPQLVDLREIPAPEREFLPHTPASVIGSSRLAMTEAYLQRICQVIEDYRIGYVLINGGNGSMRMVAALAERLDGRKTRVMGIPKTVDNDLEGTDHAPGFISCALQSTIAVLGAGYDTACAPLHVLIAEMMGRDTGWLTAATAMARRYGGAPHLIYTQENPVTLEKIMSDIDNRLAGRAGGITVAIGEGVKGEDGEPLFPPLVTNNGDRLYGSLGVRLADAIVEHLGIQARGERLGIPMRADFRSSPLDREEAILMGRMAAQKAMEGMTGQMVGLLRLSNQPYKAEVMTTPVDQIVGRIKTIPQAWFNEEKNDVNEDFLAYMAPLMDGLPPHLTRLLTPPVTGERKVIIPVR